MRRLETVDQKNTQSQLLDNSSTLIHIWKHKICMIFMNDLYELRWFDLNVHNEHILPEEDV